MTNVAIADECEFFTALDQGRFETKGGLIDGLDFGAPRQGCESSPGNDNNYDNADQYPCRGGNLSSSARMVVAAG
jgi:hypothetical protein